MRALVLILVALVLVPGARADGREPVHGHVEEASLLRLEGHVRLSAHDAALDLRSAAGGPMRLGWDEARGNLVRMEWTSVQNGVLPVHRKEGSANDSFPLAAGAVRGVFCGPDCQILLVGTPAGVVSLEGRARGALRWLDAGERAWYWAHFSPQEGEAPHEDSFLRTFGPGTIVASGGDVGTFLGEARAGAAGRVGLFVKDARVDVELTDGSATSIDVRTIRTSAATVPGLARMESVRSRFLYLEMDNASLDLPRGAGAVFLAESPRLDVAGRLDLHDATGRVTFRGATRAFSGAPVLLVGEASLRPRVEDADPAPVESPDRPGGLRLAPGDLEGSASAVRIGPDTFRADVASPISQATGVAAVVAALGWWLQRHAILLLYSRISRARVLANPNRARMYQAICERPGLTAADLRRAMGLARIVVRHHLRFLEAHRYVTARRDGRRRRWFPAGVVPEGDALAARLLLQDESRRKLIDALSASHAGLTQRELATRTGLSERLVSHHLARLAEGGLVTSRGLRPRRYTAAAWLSGAPGGGLRSS